MSYQKPCGSVAAIFVLVSQLTACGGGDSGVTSDVTHSGSVGDGPITGATVTIRDRNGMILATETSDNTANYQVTLKVPKDAYPLHITATGGIDAVTQAEPDFSLASVATDPAQSKAHINPFSTLITRMALAMPGGLTEANIHSATDTVITTFGFGFDPTLIPDPIRTPVTETNIAAMIKTSETLGETVRRARDALLIQGEAVSGDSIMNAIAADMVDGTLNGLGASGSDPRTAAVVNVVTGQVLIEAMSNQLKVGGVAATPAMDNAIRISLPEAPPTAATKNVRIRKAMIEQTQRAVEAARALAPDSALSTIASILSTLPADALPADIEQLLPGDNSTDLDRAISSAVFAPDTQLANVNKVGRDFTDVGSGTTSDTAAPANTNRVASPTSNPDSGTGVDTATPAASNTNPVVDTSTRVVADARTRNRARNRTTRRTGTSSATSTSTTTGTNAGSATPTASTTTATGTNTGSGTRTGSTTGSGASPTTGTGSGTRTRTSTPTDNQPVARADNTNTDMNQKVTLAVLNNDGGLGDTPLDVSLSGRPTHGTVTINANNTLTYTPDGDYTGQENFSYRVTDADGDVSIATITIDVVCTSGCTQAATKLTLSWNATPGDVLGYRVRYGTTTQNATREISDVIETTVTYDIADDLGMAPGDRVCFRVLAYNASGTSAPSDAVCGVI